MATTMKSVHLLNFSSDVKTVERNLDRNEKRGIRSGYTVCASCMRELHPKKALIVWIDADENVYDEDPGKARKSFFGSTCAKRYKAEKEVSGVYVNH